MSTCDKKLLQYVPFESCIEPTFWHKYTKLKLDVDMLEEKVRPIWGHYSPQYHRILNVDYTSFNKEFNGPSNNWKAHGHHLNMNTLDNFKKHDKVKMLNDYGRKLREAISSGEAIHCPSLLVNFIVLTFADLKKYHFYYWFAFLAPAKPHCFLTEPTCGLTDLLTNEQITSLFQRHRELPFDQQGFFGVLKRESEVSVHVLKDFLNILDSDMYKDCYWGFIDPCEDSEHPGWPLRNFLLLIYMQCPNLKKETLQVICLRKKQNSILLKVKFEDTDVTTEEKWIGWETNLRSKFGPRFVDLSSNMNPIKLAEESVDLNLRLMKWRLVPDLDLTSVKATSCLLLGAGTLGCSVARALLAWGVVTITLVDSGNVSYSNPVRQSLYTFEDCQKETSKAVASASALKAIFPSVKSTGVKMTIPMPGRGVNDAASVPQLEQLISDHDVVFLLTDTRESRWLPTLLAARHDKIAITAALGFDTYLILRHGKPNSPSRLGCYFCNDVTAPGNSVQDRTLDQQCTVTRPGVSHIAAALAVEMMVSLLQHPDKGGVDTSSSTCLGEVPHSIRGFLSSYSQMMPSTPAFSQCTACSTKTPKSEEEWEKVSDDFNKIWHFPHCIGAMDGKHIVIEAPTFSGSEFFNYKGTFSVVLFAVVDANYNFLYANVGCQGRISDGGVFKNTPFYKLLVEGKLNLPQKRVLLGRDKESPYVLVADDAFPLKPCIMKPYSGHQDKGSIERVFNYRISRARRIVENVFGILASVFRVFRKPMLLQPEKVEKVTLACICLHNYLRCVLSKNKYNPPNSFDVEHIDSGTLENGAWRKDQQTLQSFFNLQQTARKSSVEAMEIRKEFAEYFMSEQGQVPWQLKFC